MADTPPTPAGNAGEQSEILAFLADPASHGPGIDRVEHLETHGAHVFLAGDRALKIKRAVKFPYLDFSTLDLRRRYLTRELELNATHAPGIYLGLVPVARETDGRLRLGGKGEIVEWALRMRRFDQADLLSTVADNAGIDDALADAIADAIAAYHETAAIDRRRDPVAGVQAVIEELADAFRRFPEPGSEARAERFSDLACGHLARIAEMLRQRQRDGQFRRCHGDLHLGNMVLIAGKPTLFDALEFDEDFATSDLVYDLAFLVMDLHVRGHRRAANRVLNRYLWRRQNQSDLAALAALPLFLALRAGIRAMVCMQRAAQEATTEAETDRAVAQSLLAECLHFLQPAPPVLVAIGGFSGTGKTTIAASLAPDIGAPPGAAHLRSDLERKAMFGADELQRLPPEAYRREVGARVYALLARRADDLLRAGRSVIVDAVHADEAERAATEHIAEGLCPFAGVWLEADVTALVTRVGARRHDASDATAAVVGLQVERGAGTVGWPRVAAGGGVEDTLAQVRASIDGQLVKGIYRTERFASGKRNGRSAEI